MLPAAQATAGEALWLANSADVLRSRGLSSAGTQSVRAPTSPERTLTCGALASSCGVSIALEAARTGHALTQVLPAQGSDPYRKKFTRSSRCDQNLAEELHVAAMWHKV